MQDQFKMASDVDKALLRRSTVAKSTRDHLILKLNELFVDDIFLELKFRIDPEDDNYQVEYDGAFRIDYIDSETTEDRSITIDISALGRATLTYRDDCLKITKTAEIDLSRCLSPADAAALIVIAIGQHEPEDNFSYSLHFYAEKNPGEIAFVPADSVPG